jgi:hypothetical protein
LGPANRAPRKAASKRRRAFASESLAMGFLSAIENCTEKLRTIRLILTLSRQTPEQLTLLAQEMLQKDLEGNKWAVINYATSYAITGWALMEEKLVLIAALLLRADVEKTGLVFYSMINFQVWITIITELFELDQVFKPFQRRWNKIFERLRAEKDNRDRLAHNAIMSQNVSDNPLGVPIKIAAQLDWRSKSRKSAPMTLDQVEAFRKRIDAIDDDLQELIDDMNKHAHATAYALPKKSSEQDSGPPT